MLQAKRKRIAFLTGTRADFGKLKPLIHAVDQSPDYDCTVIVTGMHMLSLYGFTAIEVRKAGFSDVHEFMNQIAHEPMEMVLANTITGLSRYVAELQPDMLVVHGDRVEAVAGAIVGSARQVPVAHIEGGEVSGTVDESMRHATSKLASLHFVANLQARDRLLLLGEPDQRIFVIGSPEADTIVSNRLPSSRAVRSQYDIPFDDFGLALFHPVTTEVDEMDAIAEAFVEALLAAPLPFVVIYPNNDHGCRSIFDAYETLRNHPRFRLFPSIRFEPFLRLMQDARVVVGNSSAGVREAPMFGTPSVNIGTRQNQRSRALSIIDTTYDSAAILAAITRAAQGPRGASTQDFGDGRATERFMAALDTAAVWTPLPRLGATLPWTAPPARPHHEAAS